MRRRISRGPLAALMAAVLLVALVPPSTVAAWTRFESPEAGAKFGEQVWFSQVVTTNTPLARAEVLLTFPGSLGPSVVEAAGELGAGYHALMYNWSVGADGHLVPNTPISARWRLVPADRSLEPVVGPEVELRYEDTRFKWQTIEGDLVRLHWYEGSDAFGRRALEIGERAVREAADFLGVAESDPIDFYVYAEQSAFYDALGPGTRENVGGQANADIRTMFALIGPNDVTDPWVGIVIPHELTHLVFDTAVRNPYHFPPRWLNEGVAVYLSEGYTASDRSAVQAAVSGERLMPLRALGGQFPTSYERFTLAYAESSSAVDFLVRQKGTDALVSLINSYADGVTDDEAFTAAVGSDLAGFESAWLADLGAKAPTEHGPQAAPAGPLPPGWDAGGSPAAPGATDAPGATPAPSPGDDASDESPLRQGWLLVVAALAGLAVGGSAALVRRRRAGLPPGGPGAAAGPPS